MTTSVMIVFVIFGSRKENKKIWQQSIKNHPPSKSFHSNFHKHTFRSTTISNHQGTNTLTFTFLWMLCMISSLTPFSFSLVCSSIYPHKSFMNFIFPVVCLSLRQQRRFFSQSIPDLYSVRMLKTSHNHI